MRYLLGLVFLMVGTAVALKAWDGRSAVNVQPAPPRLLALTVPETAFAGERIMIYGGLRLPDGAFSIQTLACFGADCREISSRSLEGPITYWGDFGAWAFQDGEPWVDIRLDVFMREGAVERAVGTWRSHVSLSDVRP